MRLNGTHWRLIGTHWRLIGGSFGGLLGSILMQLGTSAAPANSALLRSKMESITETAPVEAEVRVGWAAVGWAAVGCAHAWSEGEGVVGTCSGWAATRTSGQGQALISAHVARGIQCAARPICLIAKEGAAGHREL